MQERRKDVGEVYLPCVAKISAREIEILRHHAEREIFRAEDSPHLAHHFFHADVGTGVARAVVSGEKQLERRTGFPGLARAEHPFELVQFDQAADPGFEQQVGHGRGSSAAPPLAFAPPLAAAAAFTDVPEGHSRYL